VSSVVVFAAGLIDAMLDMLQLPTRNAHRLN
jgi:hypothetical protein